MTQDPTAYDLLQDHRLDALDDLVHPYYQPPSEVEHSFPVVGQGVTSEMYQQMSLAQGDGVLITDDSENSYRLENMPGGPTETNQRNQMLLKVSTNTGRSEAILRGFYHVLYKDMVIDLPPVTTATTYIIALTYDPRREEEPTGPIRVEVHQNTLPRTHGRKHIVLRTVHRLPNQLLSEAAHGRGRQYVSPTITVVSEADLPEPTDVLYGTIAIVRSQTSGGGVVPGTGQIFEARGTHGWHNMLIGEWEDLHIQGGNGWSGNATIRPISGGIHLVFNIYSGEDRNRTPTASMIRLPSKYRLKEAFYTTVFTTDGPRNYAIGMDENSHFGRLHNVNIRPAYTRGNLFIPDYNLA